MTDDREPLKALERFVAENDELLELEALIGRFNIFDALGIVNAEIRHSNFLAWLLDPAESHGLGGLFLKAVLMDLLRKTPPGEHRLFSPIRLDGGEFRGVEVRREWRSIDLLITCDDPSFVIAIENKVYSSEHSDQLARYQKIVSDNAELAKYERRQFVYLTREGDEPSEEAWTVYSYADLHRVLIKVRKANESLIGDDVLTFLDHYLRIIGSRFMEDEKIAELCREIYKNHRQAIELIVAHSGSPRGQIVEAVYNDAKADSFWGYTHKTSGSFYCGPKSWLEFLPPIRESFDPPSHWITFEVRVNEHEVVMYVYGCPTRDPELRRQVLERIVSELGDVGFKFGRKKRTDEWTQIFRRRVTRFDGGDEDSVKSAIGSVRGVLLAMKKHIVSVTPALRDEIAHHAKDGSSA